LGNEGEDIYTSLGGGGGERKKPKIKY